ncbi:MAG: hypothetical protein ACTTKL_00240 [Treponema sp.]
MNKGMKKMAAIGAASVLFACTVFAKSDSKKRMRKDFSRNERMANGGMTQDSMGNSLIGDWGMRDDGKVVKVEFDRDGEMEIKWQQGLSSETEWKGFWTATETEITFTVRMKETETWTNNAKQELRENVNETWAIKYEKTDDTLTLTSSNLPKELANLTLTWMER